MEPSATLEFAPLSNGETYAYRDYGESKDAIVFIHGNENSSYIFEIILHKFTNKYRVIAPDLRGYGHSTNHIPVINPDDFVEDLKLLFDHLKLEKFVLLGWSLGGAFSMNFAAKYPHYVSNLILCHSIGVQGAALYLPDENGASTKVRVTTFEQMKTLPLVLEVEKAIEDKNEAFFEKRFEAIFLNGRNKMDAEMFKGCISECLKQKVLVNSFQILNSYNISEESNEVSEGTGEIKKIQCPVLLVYGAQDVLIPVEEGKRIQSLIGEKAQLKVFEQCGHCVFLHYPDEFVGLVNEFTSK